MANPHRNHRDPCKGEASDFDGSWNAQIPGSDASPLRERPNGTQPGSLSAVVQNFKPVSTRRINAARGAPRTPVWLRNYYEHVVRNDRELAAIRDYIMGNPADWDDDENNPRNEMLQRRTVFGAGRPAIGQRLGSG